MKRHLYELNKLLPPDSQFSKQTHTSTYKKSSVQLDKKDLRGKYLRKVFNYRKQILLNEINGNIWRDLIHSTNFDADVPKEGELIIVDIRW